MEFIPVFKTILVGKSSVGKTTASYRLSCGVYNENACYTIPCDFSSKVFKINDSKIKIQLWDTAGQERFRCLNHRFYKGASIAIVMFDIWNQESFNELEEWINNIELHWDPNVIVILVGNKSDKKEDRVVDFETAQSYANEYNIKYFEISVKDGSNFDELFKFACVAL